MLVEASNPGENLIDSVLEGSKKEALQVYERPIYDIEYGLGSGGWFRQVTQRAVKFDGPQLAVYKAVHYWRDQKAREWDEGEQSILTLAQLYGLAENMPTNPSTLYSSLRPMSKLVATNAKELISVINKAKAQGQNQSGLRDVIKITEDKFGANTVWNRKARKSPPVENRGLGNTLQMLTKSVDVTPAAATTPEAITVVDDSEVNAGRSLTSRLWGLSLPQIGSSLVRSSSIAAQALRSIMPLGEKSETSVARSDSTSMNVDPIKPSAPASDITPASPAIIDSPAPKPSDDGNDQIFTLRDRKRKAAQVADPDENLSFSGVARSKEDQARKEEKKRRKAEKRGQKEAAAAATAQIEPFDYANAQSMLNAKSDVEEQKAQRSKLVNPYAKALNTGTGAKRTNVEGPGKSFTFTK